MRVIGVVDRPQTERLSPCYRARLAGQFDVVAHMDTTTALRPLDQHSAVAAGVPETFPSGQ